MHQLLKHQLKKLGIAQTLPPTPELWFQFLEQVSQTYREMDQKQAHLEKSLTHSAREMQELYENLQQTSEARTAELLNINEQLLREIVERERAEEALKLTQFSVDNAAGLIFWIGPEAQFLYVNKTACQLLGYSSEELLAMTLHDIDANYPPEVWPSHWKSTQNRPVTVESRYLSKANQTFPVEVTFTYLEFGDAAYNFVSARDISARYWAAQALKESEERFRQVISSISVHVYMAELTRDGQWVTRYLSPTEDLTGYPPEKFSSDRNIWLSTLVYAKDRPVVTAQLDQFAAGQNSEVEYRLIRADGTLIWVRDNGRVKRDDANQHIIVYGVVSDITERKKAEEAVARARDQALEASRLKSQLLAKVSHDLRTPLGAILGYTELLQNGTFGPISNQQQEITAEVIDSTHYLTNLVNELLDQAQLEAGKLKLEISTFKPQTIVDQVQSKMNVLAQNKGLTLITDISDDIPATLAGDQTRLQQILVNLTSNAVKFTRTGEVRIRLYRPDADHWALQVTDTGPGIPPEAQSFIFEPFRQVDGSPTREYAGSGLGLSIVSQLTALMGGEITLYSQLGRGSIFTIQLPLTPIQEKSL